MTTADWLIQVEVCPKCGTFVTLENNGALLDLLSDQHPNPFVAMLTTQAFHLLPVISRGKVMCPGSPSRAQYLAGQPRDPRPQYAYQTASEEELRAVYAKMQEFVQAYQAYQA